MSDESLRLVEMERGRHIAARAANIDMIARLYQSGKLTRKFFLPGDREVDACSVFYWEGQPIYTHFDSHSGPEWPPESFMALLGLTVQALDVELPPAQPTHRVSPEAKRYNSRMQQANAHRWSTP